MMKLKINKPVGWVLLVGLLAIGCGEDEPAKEPTPPVISDVKILDNGDTFVTLEFKISNPDGAVLQEVGVTHGLKGQPLDKTEISFTNISDTDKMVSTTVTLDDDTEFDFKPYVKYGEKVVEAAVVPGYTTSKKWTLLKEFPGEPRVGAVSFAIGDKVYVGLGSRTVGLFDNDDNFADFWAYDTTSDTWIQLGDFPGGARSLAFGFALDGKGYVGSGRDATTLDSYGKTDFWEFEPISASWTKKNDLPSVTPSQPAGFLAPFADAANGIAYYGTGIDRATSFPNSKVFRYSGLGGDWTSVPDYPVDILGAVGFMIGNRVFVGASTLNNSAESATITETRFFRLNFLGTQWEAVAPLPVRPNLEFALGMKSFAIGDFGYVLTHQGKIFKYDVVGNSWSIESNKSDLFDRNLTTSLYSPVGGVIGGKAYIGLGRERLLDNQQQSKLSKKWAVFDPSK